MTASSSPRATTAADATPRVLATELGRALLDGRRVRLCGWLHRRRRLARVAFMIVRDRSGLAQVVVREPACRALLDRLGEETVLAVTGTAVANPAALHGVELVDPAIEVLAEPTETPPVQLWRPSLHVGLPTLLDHADVTLRQPQRRAAFTIAAAAVRGFRDTLTDLGFTEVHTPKIVGSATESGANVFGLDYFGRPAYLAQSPQFYKQTMVGVFERVFEVGPVFRAEPHDTVRHLAEYVSCDAELGFIRDHRDVIAVLGEVVRGMVGAVGRERDACELAGVDLPTVPSTLPVVHFTDALAVAGAHPGEPDLAPEHERALGEWARAEYASDFLLVTGYPMCKRPFYTHPQPDDPRWSNSFDLLFRGLELVTGGQRLHRYADYVDALTARGEDPAAYASYLVPFAHGMPAHGGFAFGLERFVARLTGATNIRETTLFPRDLHRLTP